MITQTQVSELAKINKINAYSVFREYLQLLFLSEFYREDSSRKVVFKGGTAIHLIFKSSRFSEDLDFTVNLTVKEFDRLIKTVFSKLTQRDRLVFKEVKTLAGRGFVLNTTKIPNFPPAYIHLDFSFREKVLQPAKSIIETVFPVAFSSYVYHMTMAEIFAEKIRAVLTRKKGRDLYDLWWLSTRRVTADKELIENKMAYYKIKPDNKQLLARVRDVSENLFISDLRPFLTIPEKARLEEIYRYIQDYFAANPIAFKY